MDEAKHRSEILRSDEERNQDMNTQNGGTFGQAGQGKQNLGIGKECLMIRAAQEEDLDQIASLEAGIFSEPWSRKAYQDILRQERYCILVASAPYGQEILGYLCGMSVLDEGELHRIAVASALRSKGYGQQLLQAFLEILRERGVSTVYLEVRAGNTPAIELYQKNGFRSVGIRKAYYQNPKEDAKIMQKTIGPASVWMTA